MDSEIMAHDLAFQYGGSHYLSLSNSIHRKQNSPHQVQGSS